MRYLQRIQSTNVSVHEYIFAQQIFTWKTKQVFALETRIKWKKTPLPREHHSCPQHQLPEEIRAGVFVPLRLQQAKTWFFLGTELCQRTVVVCLQNVNWA